jgi:hypothetical protein
MNHGISILHGPHQVARKSSVKLKSRVALRFEEDNFPARVADDEPPAKTPLVSAAVRNLLRELVAFHISGRVDSVV